MTIAVLIAIKSNCQLSPKTNLRASTGFKTMASHCYTSQQMNYEDPSIEWDLNK